MATLLGKPADHVLRAIRSGYVRAVVSNGRFLIDTTSIRLERKARWSNPVMSARAGCDQWRGLVPVIARRGAKATADAYSRLDVDGRALLDAWCKSRGIESPSLYIDH